jgi:two-component system alkaline phosphatase synthesis response regulator PhoP
MKDVKVVVVEDEADIREVMEHNLSREGYKVYSTADGESGLELVKKKLPSLVLLDLMLPGLDGLGVCRGIKADPEARATAIIIVTAKGEESDVVLGLEMGADDYVIKPFSPRELVARVRAVLRRGSMRDQASRDRIVRGEVSIDITRHEVRVEGEPVIFTPTELRLLHFLASHPGRVFTREHLLNRVIGEDSYVVDRNIDVRIRSIRKKLDKHRDLVETIRGVGYRFQDDEG